MMVWALVCFRHVARFPVVNTIGRGAGDAFADARDKLDVWAREPFWARREFLGEVTEENERVGHGSDDDSTSRPWAVFEFTCVQEICGLGRGDEAYAMSTGGRTVFFLARTGTSFMLARNDGLGHGTHYETSHCHFVVADHCGGRQCGSAASVCGTRNELCHRM